MPHFEHILSSFDPISLAEMDSVKLQNRTDTKYIFNIHLLPNILNDISVNYAILSIKNKRTNYYQTLYYDSPELKSYLQHHNEKANRTKVRFRKYIDSNLTFLEVKNKNNKGRTIKSRVEVQDIPTNLTNEQLNFIAENSTINSKQLSPKLWNSFTRITLVHKSDNERLTIDFDLSFKLFDFSVEKSVKHLVIAEIKQEKATANSDFIRAIKKYHIRKSGISKYCVGTAMLNSNVKKNNFKERILKINKLEHAS